MVHNFGENDYIDEEDDIDGECYIDAGETDIDKLFNSDWCPLLGRMPEATNMDDSSCENLSVGIISNARKLWGIKPTRIYTPTDNLIESTDGNPKELHKYPQLRLDAAQAIARTYPKVKYEADIIGFEDDRPLYSNTPLDENWKIAVEIVKKSLTVSLNEQIKDYHILSILAIAEAWDVLKSILYHNKSEDNRDIASQVRVETALLGKAKELFLEEKNKQLEQEAENVKKIRKILADSEGVHGQSNKAETVVELVSETTKPSDQKKDKDLPLYEKTPTNAKWEDLTMAFPSHLEDKVDIIFNGKKDRGVSLKDLGFTNKRATKIFKPLESLKLLKKFAKDKGNKIPTSKDDRERKKLHTQVESLRNILKQCFGIEGDPVPANGGYRLQFKAYCYDKKGEKLLLNNLKKYFRELKNEINKTKSVHDDDKIQELKNLIYAGIEKKLETTELIRLENTICTECYDKISFSILDSDNMHGLCRDCAGTEPQNEYESGYVDSKDKDIPRSD